MTIGLWSTDIEALIALDRLGEAESVWRPRRPRDASENPHAIAIAYRCRGLLLAARPDIPAAIDALDAALAAHALRPIPVELGRTLIEIGSLQRRAKRKSAAKQSLEQALAILEPLGAAPWVARARDELGRIGLRRAAGGDGPTPAQQRVAELLGHRGEQPRNRGHAPHEPAQRGVAPHQPVPPVRRPVAGSAGGEAGRRRIRRRPPSAVPPYPPWDDRQRSRHLDREDCERLVRAFYGRALTDPVIGFIFVDVAQLDLEAHVPRIASFWETILLGAQSYGGGAFRPHAALNAQVRAAGRALRAVAVAVAHDRRRAVRRRAGRAGQDPRRAGRAGLPRAAAHAGRGAGGRRAADPDDHPARSRLNPEFVQSVAGLCAAIGGDFPCRFTTIMTFGEDAHYLGGAAGTPSPNP